MKTILISGSNGFIARKFCKKFASKYNFILLSHKAIQGHITLDDLAGNQSLINSIDVVLNLAGANIGDKRWSNSRKTEIIESRVKTTGQLVELFNRYNHNAHFISASAIGIYPTDSTYDESYVVEYHKYDNFSQEITRKWEQSAKQYNGKLTITRFGVYRWSVSKNVTTIFNVCRWKNWHWRTIFFLDSVT
jgi:NAD dependent epimerase/dehydratase family enzyme